MRQLTLRTFQRGDVMVADHRTHPARLRQHPEAEPPLLGRGVARVLELEPGPSTGQYRAQPVGHLTGAVGPRARRAVADGQVVHTDTTRLQATTISRGRCPPCGVDSQDYAVRGNQTGWFFHQGNQAGHELLTVPAAGRCARSLHTMKHSSDQARRVVRALVKVVAGSGIDRRHCDAPHSSTVDHDDRSTRPGAVDRRHEPESVVGLG